MNKKYKLKLMHSSLLLNLDILEFFVKHPISKFLVVTAKGLQGVDKSSNVSLTIELFFQPYTGQPVSCMRVIFPSHLSTDINHRLHTGCDCLLHLQSIPM